MKSQRIQKRSRQEHFTQSGKIKLNMNCAATWFTWLVFTSIACSKPNTSFNGNSKQKKPSVPSSLNPNNSQNSDSSADGTGTGTGTGTDNAGSPGSSTTSVDSKSGVQKSDPISASKQPFQACMSNGMGSSTQPIVARVYQLPNGTESLPENWDENKHQTTICMTKFDVQPRIFSDGFPGIPSLYEWFGISARAKLVAPNSGNYKFRILSDDGSILIINNNVVINHDGQHPPSSKEGSVHLDKATHELQIRYFQGPADEIALQLFWTPPGGSEEIVPTSAFKPY